MESSKQRLSKPDRKRIEVIGVPTHVHLVKLTSFPMAWTPDVGMSECVQRYAESMERGVCVTVQYACKGHAVYWDINIMVCLHMWQKQTVLESPSHLSEGPQRHDMIWAICNGGVSASSLRSSCRSKSSPVTR